MKEQIIYLGTGKRSTVPRLWGMGETLGKYEVILWEVRVGKTLELDP